MGFLEPEFATPINMYWDQKARFLRGNRDSVIKTRGIDFWADKTKRWFPQRGKSGETDGLLLKEETEWEDWCGLKQSGQIFEKREGGRWQLLLTGWRGGGKTLACSSCLPFYYPTNAGLLWLPSPCSPLPRFFLKYLWRWNKHIRCGEIHCP